MARLLIDTNIVVHREAGNVTNESIGRLYRLLEKHGYAKLVHPATADELSRLQNDRTRSSMKIKLSSYQLLAAGSPLAAEVSALSAELDKTANSVVDSMLINEVYVGTVDLLLTEDRGIHRKAARLGIQDAVYTIDTLLERILAEHPDLIDYPVPSVTRTYVGRVCLDDPFFDSFRSDYVGFDRWFRSKNEEPAYVAEMGGSLSAFLYLKAEGPDEPYNDISPALAPARRLKIGTLKVLQNGYRLGERLLKIVFDNAIRQGVDEVYVTVFPRSIDQIRLIKLLSDFGFYRHGKKTTPSGTEDVWIRSMKTAANRSNPTATFPFISPSSRRYIVPIYPGYHTSLFPDSILRTESPEEFVEQEPHRNAIRKVYISRSINRDLEPGDAVVFYRTGGYYKGVATTLGIVESMHDGIASLDEFRNLCRKRSVFTDDELVDHWNYKRNDRPFVVRFLGAHSFPRRPNMKRLIEIGVIASVDDAPRGFEPIPGETFDRLLSEAGLDASSIVH